MAMSDGVPLNISHRSLAIVNYTLRKKRYKSCHWGWIFSKGTLLYPKAKMYILTPKCPN